MHDFGTSTALRQLFDLGQEPDPPRWHWAITRLDTDRRLLLPAAARPYMKAIDNAWSIPDMRRYGEQWSLLFRPVAQDARCFGAWGSRRQRDSPSKEAVERAVRVDWRADSDFWIDTVIRSNGRMVANAQSIMLAGRLIAYLIAADRMSDFHVDRLRNDYASARGWMIQHRRPMPRLPKQAWSDRVRRKHATAMLHAEAQDGAW